jgi:hypothetical protein
MGEHVGTLLRARRLHAHQERRLFEPFEAGETYTMPHAVAHATAKRGVVARERPADRSPPSILTLLEVLTEADVLEAEAELRALQRHALEVIDSEADD